MSNFEMKWPEVAVEFESMRKTVSFGIIEDPLAVDQRDTQRVQLLVRLAMKHSTENSFFKLDHAIEALDAAGLSVERDSAAELVQQIVLIVWMVKEDMKNIVEATH